MVILLWIGPTFWTHPRLSYLIHTLRIVKTIKYIYIISLCQLLYTLTRQKHTADTITLFEIMFQRAEIDSKCRSPAKGSIRTIPKLIEFNARNNPDYLFCQQAQKPAENLDSPFELLDITYHQLKCAILRCEDWLVENINGLQLPHINDQGGVTKGSPVALLMGSDVGLLFHMFALLGLGVPVSFTFSLLSIFH
jgi:hypothetical protein